MYRVHDWAEVHRLFHREEWTKTKIAGKLGMSRNTMARLLELSEPPQYELTQQGSKLDPHKGSIARMLKEDAGAPATDSGLRKYPPVVGPWDSTGGG